MKKVQILSEPFKRTRSRDRTGTSLTSLVFETSASTNSAIRANGARLWSAKIEFFSFGQNNL
jgi:hypothetical protein